MGNKIAKTKIEDQKSKRHHQNRNHPNREHHKRRRRHHHGSRDERVPGPWPTSRECPPTRHMPNSYDMYYHPASKHWQWDCSRPPEGWYYDQTENSAPSACSYVPLQSHRLPHHVAHINRLPPSYLPSSYAPHSGIRRLPSGFRTKYKSRLRSNRITSAVPGAFSDESHTIRGMVVYKNGKEETLKVIGDNSEAKLIKEESICTHPVSRPHEAVEKDVSSPESARTRLRPPPSDTGEKLQLKRSISNIETAAVKFVSEPLTNVGKKTIMSKFWDSSLGKKLPIGGPLAWLRPRNNEVNLKNNITSSVVVLAGRSKPRTIWSGLKRRFLWKSTSRRRPSSSRPDGQEAEEQAKHASSPTSPGEPELSNRHAPSRQYVWKTAPTVMNTATEDGIENIDLIHTPAQKSSPKSVYQQQANTTEEVISEISKHSPYIPPSRYIWRSANRHQASQAWSDRNIEVTNKPEDSTHKKRRKRNPRSYLWRKDGAQGDDMWHHEKTRQRLEDVRRRNNLRYNNESRNDWCEDAVLYHH